MFAEFATGGTGTQRLVLIAARVLAVHAMLDGASFIETFRMLGRDAGMDDASAFGVALRVHRSGGLSKDAIYLQGLQQVLQHVAGGGELEPFWYGKIAAHHFNVLQELRARGMLRDPAVRPAFLSQPRRHQAFIEAAGAGLGVRDLIQERADNMKIAFFVNDMAREEEHFATTILANEASRRGHTVCYATPSDFSFMPDDRLQLRARFAPKKKFPTLHGVLQGDPGSQDRDAQHRCRANSTC